VKSFVLDPVVYFTGPEDKISVVYVGDLRRQHFSVFGGMNVDEFQELRHALGRQPIYAQVPGGGPRPRADAHSGAFQACLLDGAVQSHL
jgi:hypothetical protein